MAVRAGLCFSSAATSRSRSRRQAAGAGGFVVVRCDGRSRRSSHSDLPLPLPLVAKILGAPTSFNAAKLKVEFAGEVERPPTWFPRAYTLSHCDLTANLTLAVSVSGPGRITSERWRWHRDDVLAEWKEMATGEATLHLHCCVSGGSLLQDLAAGLRYYVFSKELPLVLQAVVHGDAALFAERPELMEATVWVHFHSTSSKYNRIQCWGPLREATKRNLALRLQMDQLHLHTAIARRRREWTAPETIFSALLALLLWI